MVSSKDNRFDEFIKCFELLFDVTADQIMADYNELVPLVNITTTTYQYNYKPELYGYEFSDSLVNDYDWITLSPNRNWY